MDKLTRRARENTSDHRAYVCMHMYVEKPEENKITPERMHRHGDTQVLPVSFFERGNNAFFNSVVVFDADGRRLGLYRKSHIPDGPGYQVCSAQQQFFFLRDL